MFTQSGSVANQPAATTVIGIAASAGGIAAISAVLSALPHRLPAAIAIVQHLYPRARSHLPQILARVTTLPVLAVHDGDLVRHGRVYVAPPDWHMLITRQCTIHLVQSAPVHHVRPSADCLFESLMQGQFERVICAVLSGSGMDGCDGARQVRLQGGVIIAQDKASCEHYGMPGACANGGGVDYMLPLNQIGPTIRELLAA